MVTKSVGNKRLLALADFLDTVPPERFDYGYWVGADWKGKADLSCGTTACALGWATAMPRFRRLGLHLNENFDVQLGFDQPYWDQVTGTRAGEELFGLDGNESYLLFLPSEDEGNATAQYVAEKIRRLVEAR